MAVRKFAFLLAGLGVLGAGCSNSKVWHDAEYVDLSYIADRAATTGAEEIVNPIVPPLAGPHSVEEFIQVAIAQNPEIQAARKRLEAAAYQVPVEASLQDPMLNMTVLPAPVQTAAGEQDVIVSGSQKFPWPGKLDRRGLRAEAQTDVLRAELAATELGVIEQVQKIYYELYYVQQAIAVTEEEQNLLAEIRDVASARYKAGKTSQQDVLRAELEISDIENRLIQLRQQQKSTRARLAGMLHIAPQTELQALEKLPGSQIVEDLEALQKQAVSARPELHARLAAIDRDRQAVDLALLDYKPDVTVGLTWIGVDNNGLSRVANGQDVVMLQAGINLPVYRKRLDAQVHSAEAKAVASARDYDSFRDNTLAQVVDLFAKVQSQRDLLTLFEEDILPRSRQTLEVSSRGYNVGEVDFLQLLDNWQQLLRYELAYRRIDASLRQTMAELERVVGGFLGPHPAGSPKETSGHPMVPPVPDIKEPKEKKDEQPTEPQNEKPADTGDQKPDAGNREDAGFDWPASSRMVRPAGHERGQKNEKRQSPSWIASAHGNGLFGMLPPDGLKLRPNPQKTSLG